MIGHFINAIISFVIIALVIFLFVKPMNMLMTRMKRGEEPPPAATKQCPECLSEIPIAACRRAFCTSVLEGAPA